MLHRLEAADRTPELGALLDVFNSHIQHCGRASQHGHAMPGHGPLDGPLGDGPAAVHLAEYRTGRQPDVVQRHLKLPLRADGAYGRNFQPHHPRGNEEQRYALRRIAALRCPGGHDNHVGDVGIGDEELGAVQRKAVALGGGGGLHAPGFVAGRCLGDR